MIIVIVLAIFLVLILGSNLLRYIAVNIINSRLADYLESENYAAYEKLVNSLPARLTIDPYNRGMLLLNEAMAKDAADDVKDILEELEPFLVSDETKKFVYTNAFFYFMNREDNEEAEKYYHKLKEFCADSMYGVDRAYDTFIKKGSYYLERTLNELKSATKEQAAGLESMAAIMYENRGDKKNAEHYRELSEKHVSELLEEEQKKAEEKAESKNKRN